MAGLVVRGPGLLDETRGAPLQVVTEQLANGAYGGGEKRRGLR
jgi:hypothetical protein